MEFEHGKTLHLQFFLLLLVELFVKKLLFALYKVFVEQMIISRLRAEKELG